MIEFDQRSPSVDDVDVVATARLVADDVLSVEAEGVDRDSRFPQSSVDGLRGAGLLAALLPCDRGGLGANVGDLVKVAEILGSACGSTAMIWAMHQIQVASIAMHGRNEFFNAYLDEIAGSQPLLGSATSEVGVGGNIFRSIAALESGAQGKHRLLKEASTVSYGAHADGILATARKGPQAEPHEQVLVLLLKDDGLVATPRGTWNTMGMRGTVSPAFEIDATFPADRVLNDSFDVIAAETMIPLSHLLWSACWIGIANGAFRRAAGFARGRSAGSGSADTRLAEAQGHLRVAQALLLEAVATYGRLLPSGCLMPDGDSSRGEMGPEFTVAMNTLKIEVSLASSRVAEKALEICGIAGYMESGPFSVSRHIRDLFSARLMISNQRLTEANAHLSLVTGR